MAATITIRRWTGTTGAPAKTDISGINTRANAEDAHTVAGTTNSILVPTDATLNYSYWVSTRLSCDTITGGTVDNLRWYTDGSDNFGTGVTNNTLAEAADTYVTATGTPGTSGNELTTANHSGLTANPVNPFSYTSGAPKALSGSTAATGDFGAWLVYQLGVTSAASSGATAQETFTWKYDDTSS
jgi:hypothetical protein